jgi:hypothetical protein
MPRYRITAPVEHVTCSIAGVMFADSLAETDSEPAVAYFRRHGYGVEEILPEPEPEPEPETPKKAPAKKAAAKVETQPEPETPKEVDQ